MAEQEIIDLLTQIRDLQRQHVENYHHAIEQQKKAIRLQKRAMLIAPFLVLAFVVLFLILYQLTNR
jgi:hypothetical protein